MDLQIDPQKAARAYGSFNAWADALDVPLTTVLGWRNAGKVPHWRIEKVAAKAVSDGKDIFGEGAPAKPASKRKARAI